MVEIFEGLTGTRDSKADRLRRSEMLLSRLYHDQTRPRFRVPQVRGARTLFVISILSLVVFSGALFWKFNAFILLREDALAKAGNLEGAVQRRVNLFGNMIKLTLSHAALEHSIFVQTAKTRTELMNRMDAPEAGNGSPSSAATDAAGQSPEPSVGGDPLSGDWSKTLKTILGSGDGMEASLGRLLAVVEQYPDIQSSHTYQQAMTSLVDMENLIAQRRIELHTAVRDYNTGINKFPWKLLAEVADFKRIEYFSAGQEGGAAPVITPALYEQLLPLDESEEPDK